jgi:hypothetical protein
MADDKWVPDPPAGLHGPTADAPGSILDPKMRKAIREVLTPALVETFRYLAGEIAKGNVTRPPDLGDLPMPPMPQMPMPMPCPMPGGRGQQQPPPDGNAATAAAAAPVAPAPPTIGAMPFPHGDMDLSFISPNVVTANVPRTGQERQFYFLKKPNVPGGG